MAPVPTPAEAIRRLRRCQDTLTRDDIIAAVVALADRTEDLAADVDAIDRRARPHGDGTDLDSRRRRWARGRR